jgi:polysaccharide deacetylase family protein (PEP-CTERM system associated)
MKTKTFLFSVDLEDIRFRMDRGEQYQERVRANVNRYLNWLERHHFKATFFTVGDIAEKYPEIIREIAEKGHEIGCHTLNHIPLDEQTPESFKKDISANIELLLKAGAKEVTGFRAPVFSLTDKTAWAYEVLKQAGIKYSSSVLPAPNPLYGWPGFGMEPRKMDGGIWEIPMTLHQFGTMKIPFGGGVYFRVLPYFLIKRAFMQTAKKQVPVIGYFHPYDIDTQQERFMHPGINNSRFYNYLMYYNRESVFERLDKLVSEGFRVETYDRFVKEQLEKIVSAK